MRPLTETQIANIEAFIADNEASPPPCLSERDVPNTKTRYAELKDQPPHTYYMAGHNANGFTMFTLYKSTDHTIYILTSYIQTLGAYYKVEEDWISQN